RHCAPPFRMSYAPSVAVSAAWGMSRKSYRGVVLLGAGVVVGGAACCAPGSEQVEAGFKPASTWPISGCCLLAQIDPWAMQVQRAGVAAKGEAVCPGGGAGA